MPPAFQLSVGRAVALPWLRGVSTYEYNALCCGWVRVTHDGRRCSARLDPRWRVLFARAACRSFMVDRFTAAFVFGRFTYSRVRSQGSTFLWLASS